MSTRDHDVCDLDQGHDWIRRLRSQQRRAALVFLSYPFTIFMGIRNLLQVLGCLFRIILHFDKYSVALNHVNLILHWENYVCTVVWMIAKMCGEEHVRTLWPLSLIFWDIIWLLEFFNFMGNDNSLWFVFLQGIPGKNRFLRSKDSYTRVRPHRVVSVTKDHTVFVLIIRSMTWLIHNSLMK